MIKVLIFLLLLSSCDKPKFISEDITEYPEHDQTWTSFENEFSDLMTLPRSTTRFASLREGLLGVCEKQAKIVSINKTFWQNAGSDERKALLFHELVHCELGIAHFGEGLMNSGFPKSVVAFKDDFDCQMEDVRIIKDMMDQKIILNELASVGVKYYYENWTKEDAHADLDRRILTGEFYLWDDHSYIILEPVGRYSSKIKIPYNVCGGKY